MILSDTNREKLGRLSDHGTHTHPEGFAGQWTVMSVTVKEHQSAFFPVAAVTIHVNANTGVRTVPTTRPHGTKMHICSCLWLKQQV